MTADAALRPDPRAPAERLASFLMTMRARGIRDTALLSAVERAPRELFLPPAVHHLAYEPVEASIGCGQSAPSASEIVLRLASLHLQPRDAVLEIGAGSGYQTALLALCGRRVVAAERFRTLALEGSRRLAQLGLGNASVRHADGLEGVATHGRYDLILLNGGVSHWPDRLLDLLAPQGGRMLGPLGSPGELRLTLLERRTGGDASTDLGPVDALMLRPGPAAML